MIRLVCALTLGLCVASSAEACIRSSLAFDFKDSVENEFKYLICLHNEHVVAINALNDQVRTLSSDLDNKDWEIIELQRQVRDLEDRVDTLERR